MEEKVGKQGMDWPRKAQEKGRIRDWHMSAN